jgi:hypothetical protein
MLKLFKLLSSLFAERTNLTAGTVFLFEFLDEFEPVVQFTKTGGSMS